MAVSPRAAADVDGAAELDVRCERRGTVRTITAEGEIDLGTVERLKDALHADGDGPGEPEMVVVDLSGVTFIDSTGVSTLVEATHRLRDQRCRLVVLPVPAGVRAVFELCGLLDLLPIADEPLSTEG